MTTSREFPSALDHFDRYLTANNNPSGEEGEAFNLVVRDRVSSGTRTLGVTISNRDAHELAEWIKANVPLPPSTTQLMNALPSGSVVRLRPRIGGEWEGHTWHKVRGGWTSSTGIDSPDISFMDTFEVRVEYNPNDQEEDE